MLSESARMNSAAEARFRIQATDSNPQTIKVIALDAHSDYIITSLAASRWEHATFFTASAFNQAPLNEQMIPQTAWLRDLAGQPQDLHDLVETADLIVMVAAPGGQAQAASIIGNACSRRRVMTTGLLVGAAAAADDAVSQTLAQLRPWSLMLVVADPEDYIRDMLTALRA